MAPPLTIHHTPVTPPALFTHSLTFLPAPSQPPLPASSSLPQLCDFNLSRVVPHGEQLAKSLGTMANSPAWASPEMLSGGHYGYPHDVFSFGVILWEIITLQVGGKEGL